MSDQHTSVNVFDLINSICDKFRKAWKSGKRPQIETFLLNVPEHAREQLFRNLLMLDIRYRERNGERPEVADYLQRFPELKRAIGDVFHVSMSMSRVLDDEASSFAAAMTASFEVPAARQIGDYELLREVGRGGFGVVFEAKHLKTGHRVALKTLPTGFDGQEINAERLHRFRREFRALAEVNHPNLVGMQTLEVDGRQWFFTMDLIDGDDFLSYVRPSGTLDESRLRDALEQLVRGVVALHERGILHRDLKPSNVLVGRDGHVSILDFGLVAQLEQAGDQQTASLASLPTQHFVGTPRYASPEQVVGQRSPAADWYAVGTMLYEALLGKPPFPGNSTEILIRKREEDAPRLSGHSELPSDLTELADRLLHRTPSARPSSDEIAEHLTMELQTTSRSSRSAGSSHGSRAPESLEEEPWDTDSGPTLLGRDEQLAHLDAAQQEWLDTRAPLAVWITGLSGEGKSTLADSFLRAMRRSPHQVRILSGRCYDRESVPFKAIDVIMEALVTVLKSFPEEQIEGWLPHDIHTLAHLFPALRRIPAIDQRSRVNLANIDDRQIRLRAFAALRDLLTALSRQTPVVMFIDDLQWGDADSAEVLVELLGPPDPPTVLMLGSYRSDEAEQSPFLKEWRVRTEDQANLAGRIVDVPPLTPEQCQEFLAQRVGNLAEISPDELAATLAETKGNPYFLEQLVDGYNVEQGQFEARPLQEIVTRKLGNLPSDATPLLQAIAVAGQSVSIELVARVAELDQSTAFSTVTHMRSERLVRMVGSAGEPVVDTYHDKIRETVREEMPTSVRHDLHLKFAEQIIRDCPGTSVDGLHVEGDQLGPRIYDLAYHFHEAQDPRAFPCQLLAGKTAVRNYAMEAALEHLQAARQTKPATAPDAIDYELEYFTAKCLAAINRLDGALEGYERAVQLADSNLQRAACYYEVGVIHWRRSEYDQGFANLRRALAQLGERYPHTTPGKLLAGVIALATFVLVPKSLMFRLRRRSEAELTFLTAIYQSLNWMVAQLDYNVLLLVISRACVLARHISDRRVKSESFSNLAWCFTYAGGGIFVKRLLRRAEALHANVPDNEATGVFAQNLAFFHYFAGNLRETEPLMNQCIRQLRRSGDYRLALAEHFTWHLWSHLGSSEQILQFATAEEATGRRTNDSISIAYASYGQAEAHAKQGRIERARELAERALGILVPLNASMISIAEIQKSRVELYARNYTIAREPLWRSVKAMYRRLVYCEISVPAFGLLVEAILGKDWASGKNSRLSSRDRWKARAFSTISRMSSRQFPSNRPLAYRMTARVCTARGKVRSAMKWFDRAIRVAEQLGCEYERARALLDKSMLDYPQATADRQRGLDLMESLGCVVPEAEIEYLGIDRTAHFERAAAARGSMAAPSREARM